MRFIITAQPGTERKASDPPGEFDADLFKAYMRFNEEMHQAGVLVASLQMRSAETIVRKVEGRAATMPVDRRFTHVWRQTNGQWRLVARHANVVAPR